MQTPTCGEQSFHQKLTILSSNPIQSPDLLQLMLQVNMSVLRNYVQHIEDFGPHPTGSASYDAVGKYLYDTLSSFNLSVQYNPWTYKLRQGKNIEATLQGQGFSNSTVFLSAHYDSVTISPGADDDGSGVAIVLAAAEILSHYKFNCTIKFVLFSGEEQGLYGSHEYVQKLFASKEKIIGDLNLDGMGYAANSEDGHKIKHYANSQSAWMVDISQKIASVYADTIGLEVIKLPHVTFSDHQSFVKYNYQASYLNEYSINPYYHTSDDLIKHINITYLAKLCKLTLGTLASMAELHPLLNDNDLKITIRGSLLAYPSQFSIRIENKKFKVDTANITINISMKNLFTGEYVKNSLNASCNWSFIEEIKDIWEFKTITRKYLNQLITIQVIVKGIHDDVTLYTNQHSVGMNIGWEVFIIPK
jgi:Peptidase family M28